MQSSCVEASLLIFLPIVVTSTHLIITLHVLACEQGLCDQC